MSGITIGRDRNGKELVWDLRSDDLPNRHLLILGATGSGKTYAAAHMLRENSRSGLPAIVFDYSDSFSPYQIDDMDVGYRESIKDKLKYIDIKTDKVPVNPFRLLNIEKDEKETENDAAVRIADLFKPVFGFGDQQRHVLYHFFHMYLIAKSTQKSGGSTALQYKMLDTNDSALVDWILKQETNNPLRTFKCYLEEWNDAASDSKNRVLSKMAAFINSDPFTSASTIDWDDYICNDGKITVFGLSRYSDYMRKIMLEFLLWDLFDYASRVGSKNRPFVTVFDECHELKFTKASPVYKILRQGRKFGFSAWFITQYMGKKTSNNDEMIDLLEMAHTKIFFQSKHSEFRYISETLNPDNSSEWLSDVSSLRRGECIAKGSFIKQKATPARSKEYPPIIITIPKL